ncbi:MAG: PadR family transcriptional regulator [Candidatus Thermoplasmatota archaeon]
MARVATREYVSVPINAKTLLLQELKKGDVLLFLYQQGVDKYPAYNSFIKTGLENNQLCFYAYEAQEHKWHPEIVFKKYIDTQQLHLLPLESKRNPILQLESKLKLLYQRAKAKRNTLRALIDFGNTITSHNADDIISWERKMIEKSKKFSSIGVNAMNIDSLSHDKIGEVLKLHEKAAVFTPYEVGIMLNFSARRKFREIPVELVSLEPVEQFVKNNLENIVLFLLQEKPLCGYDIIKTISQRYHIFLSQGTVYPLLYSLTQQRLLVSKQELKAKVYYPTAEGIKIIQNRLNEFRKAHEYMLSLFGKVKKH